jgi:bifunctional UDP-N-acetylglucosamine pyrophosphorylase / glucosamine-1-phosphate N-acetyltransferase
MTTAAIVLAAGKGTRMKSDLAKVLHSAAGKTLIQWTLETLGGTDVSQVVVVVGHQADAVAATLPSGVRVALQEHQHGTGHAAGIGLASLAELPETILVLPGDMPLIRSTTLAALLATHHRTNAAATVLSVIADDPTGYGRLVHTDGELIAIVEESDATPEQQLITEVNTSVMAFEASKLRPALDALSTDNVQGELYLTDVIGVLRAAGSRVGSYVAEAEEGLGVNSIDQLAVAAAVLEDRDDVHSHHAS